MKFPRSYISFSQISSFEKSEKTFIDRYYKNVKTFETKALTLGKQFSEALENKKEGIPENVIHFAQLFSSTLPEGQHEAELRSNYEYNGKVYELFGKVDFLADDLIYEFKTGTKKWNELRAEKHGQVLLYQLMMKLAFNKEVKGLYVWFPTENNFFTGEIKYFDIPYKEENMDYIKSRINRFIDFVENHKMKQKLVIT